MGGASPRFEFTLEAIEEARQARLWYADRSPKAEKAFLAELRIALRRIREAPTRWPQHDHGTRRRVLNRFPFDVVYRILKGGGLQIVAIAHQKRRPGYWKRRH